jgi:hypothetical protein
VTARRDRRSLRGARVLVAGTGGAAAPAFGRAGASVARVELGARAEDVDRAVEALGGLDVLVLEPAVPAADLEPAFAAAFTAAAGVLRAALPHLERAPRGVVVARLSTRARTPAPGAAAAVAAEHGLRGLLSSLRLELRASRSRVRVAIVIAAPRARPEPVAAALVAATARPRPEVAAGASAIARVLLFGVARGLYDRLAAAAWRRRAR